ARCRDAADAARPLRVPHRPAVALDATRDRERAGERFAGVSLSCRRRILRRAHGGGRHLLDVLLLVRRVPLPHGRSAEGAVLLREDARLRQSPGLVRRGAGTPGAASRQLPPGVHAPRAHQRRLRSGPPALGGRPCRVIFTPRDSAPPLAPHPPARPARARPRAPPPRRGPPPARGAGATADRRSRWRRSPSKMRRMSPPRSQLAAACRASRKRRSWSITAGGQTIFVLPPRLIAILLSSSPTRPK